MQRLLLPPPCQAQGRVLARLWRSPQAGSHFSGGNEFVEADRVNFQSSATEPNSQQPSQVPQRSRRSVSQTGGFAAAAFQASAGVPSQLEQKQTRGFATALSVEVSPKSERKQSRGFATNFATTSEASLGQEQDDGCPRSLDEYNDVLIELARKMRTDAIHNVYDDLVLDGITPDRTTYHTLIAAQMRSRNLQEVLYFYDAMMMQGLIPDSTLFHIILRACARARAPRKAFEVADEMEAVGTPRTLKTFQHLLNVCAKTGQIDQATEVVGKMKAKGLVLSKFCYAALIEATGNQKPHPGRNLTGKAIMDLFEEARRNRDAWTDPYESIPRTPKRARLRPNHYDEEDEPVREREDLVVYKAGVAACKTISYQPGVYAVMASLKEDKTDPDGELIHLAMVSMLAWRDFNEAAQLLEEWPHVKIGETSVDVKSLLLDAMFAKRSALAKQLLERLLEPKTRTYLSARDGNDLLSMTSKMLRKHDFSVPRMMWDVLASMNIKPWMGAAKDYFRALQINGFTPDDPHFVEVKSHIDLLASGVLQKTPFAPPIKKRRAWDAPPVDESPVDPIDPVDQSLLSKGGADESQAS